MEKQKSKRSIKSKKVKNKKPRKLKRPQVYLLKIASLLIKLWTRTLRFQVGAEVQAEIAKLPSPSIPVVWHNRLFAVPEFYTRYAQNRKLAVIVSASSAGAWLAELFEQMGIHPIRGSRHRRGAQAFREMLRGIQSGYDVGISPDGSRGPMYDMKPGVAMLALRTEAPVVLLSFNFKHAWRLSSWDHFYIPFPFSRVEVKLHVVQKGDIPADANLQEAASALKVRLCAITEDNEYEFSDANLSNDQKASC